QAANQLGVTVAGKTVNLVANLSPMEATAAVKLDTGNDVAEQLADLKAAAGGGKAAPIQLPRIRRNPNGGSYVAITERSFPLTLAVSDALRRPFVARGKKGGLIFVLKPSNFPFEATFGQLSNPETNVSVPRDKFPVILQLGAAPQATAAGSEQAQPPKPKATVVTVNKHKLPVRVSINPV
ncbi:MAG TPA: hypothetical protein VFS10_03580, partial [Pyrinomonadaceae bacterium]|nr:hypothetical protein [Pyrinomonadaceae bacterium]